MSSSDFSARRRHLQHQRRPQTITELSERALDNLYDEARPLKHFLRVAEKYRKDARDYISKGDLENAFINFARAATLVLDKLPAHRDYYTLLTSTQRANLNMNGTDILEELGNLKRKLTKRYEDWVRDHPEGEQPEPPTSHSTPDRHQEIDLSLRRTRSKGKERERGRHDNHRRISEDYALWRQDEHLIEDIDDIADRERRRHALQGAVRDRGVVVTTPQPSPHIRQAKKEAAVSAARQAVYNPQSSQAPDYTFSRPPLRSQNGQAGIPSNADGPDMSDDRKRYAEIERQYHYEQQQKEMKHREEEIMRRREESRRRKDEEDAIMRRQHEANEAARMERTSSQTSVDVSGPRQNTLSTQGSVASIASASSLASTAPSTLFPPTSASSSAVTTPSSFYQNPAASSSTMMPSYSASPYYAPAPSQRVSPSPSPYYATTQARVSPPYATAQARVSPPEPSPYRTQTSSAQQIVSASGSSSTQVVMPSSSIYAPPPTSFYAPPSSSSQPPYQNPGSSLTTVMYTNSSRSHDALPQPPVIPKPASQEVAQQSNRPSSVVNGGPTLLPLEPNRFETDSTDSESVHEGHRSQYNGYADRFDYNRTPTRRRTRSPSPVTTTSPPPQERRTIEQVMSQHQRSQGYYPSTKSMFSSSDALVGHPPMSAPLYSSANEALHRHPPRSASMGSYQYPSAQRPSPPTSSHAQSSHLRPNYPELHQRTPVPAAPVMQTPPRSQPRHHHAPSPSVTSTLKTVTVPKDCLQKFLGIASANTAVNKETCGLLLGKDKGSKYTVTTLLIPKQHSTSDTCTMDGEELVLQFTEERSLITLGWIHTHPSQSCFMSSVDLHTHSGFQRMLPESFAIVCAPKSKPNFGVFRLTDPPGLKTILDCKATDAFHPHPDLPIYTDADRGHVQMKEVPLEIVDLR